MADKTAGNFTHIAAIVQRCFSITFGIPANRREMQTQGQERGLFGGSGGVCSGLLESSVPRMNARVSHHSITSTLERRVGLLEKSSDIISYLYLFFHLFIIYMINRKRCLKENRDCGADTDRIITCLRFFLAAR